MYNVADFNGNCKPTVSNCYFIRNSSVNGGGMSNSVGIFGGICSPTVSNCTFSMNTGDNGGGMYNYSSTPDINNSTFSGNSTSNVGGGMYNVANSNPAISNCKFDNNTSVVLDFPNLGTDASETVTINSWLDLTEIDATEDIGLVTSFSIYEESVFKVVKYESISAINLNIPSTT